MKEKIIIFTGAGLSASSGIPTFRDENGLWEKHKIEDICSVGCLDWNYEKTIEFYNKRRIDLKDKISNNAHKMIARVKEKYHNKIEVITQNIDDLLERANCKDILHLHGFLPELKCMNCEDIININYNIQNDKNSTCIKCNGKMRPNIVFFGEIAPKYKKMFDLLQECGLLVVIGTSGYVIDVDSLTQYCDYSILNNLEVSSSINENYFTKVYYEDANTAYKKIEEDIEKFMNEKKL